MMNISQAVAHARSQSLGDLLRRSAKRTPGKLALAFRDRQYTFAELDDVVNRTANALAEKGIGHGDVCAMLSHNNDAFIIIRFALARLGAVIAPFNFMLNASELAYLLGNSGAVAFVAEDALVATAQAAVAEAGVDLKFKAVVAHAGSDVAEDWERVEQWFAHSNNGTCWTDVGDDEPVQLMYTSGTESRPKGAMLSARSLYAQYNSCIIDGEMSAQDVELHCLPLYHCAQLDCFLTVDLYLGATSYLLEAPDPAVMLEMVERHKITKLFCPPTIWIAMLRHPDFDSRDLSSLEKGYYGASIMPTPVIEELAQRLPSMRLYNFYGQTELAPVATVLKPEDQLRKLGSAGMPALNVETMIVDDEDNPLPVGELGEIVHRSPHTCLGYFQNEEKTAEAFRNGWFHSGDLGRMDEEGYLYVVDRKKDMIKSGGENVASREVEEMLYKYDAVAEVAVFGVPHPHWIEAVVAVVVPKAGVTVDVDDLMQWSKDHLAGYKTPKRIVVVDALPKNASGKILKRELKDAYKDSFGA